MARFRERWRAREAEGLIGFDRGLILQGTLADYVASLGCGRSFSKWTEAERRKQVYDYDVSDPRRQNRREPDMVEVIGAVPRPASAWAAPERWEQLVAGDWRRPGTTHYE